MRRWNSHSPATLVIVGGADAWRIANLLRERRVAVIIAGVHALPLRRDEDIDARFRLPALLAQAGVAFCIARDGSTFAAPHERTLPYEAATAAAYGLPRDEALRSVTLYPAQVLGVAGRLGSIGPGKVADLIVTECDPLEITTRVEQVYINGRPVSMETPYAAVRQVRRAAPRCDGAEAIRTRSWRFADRGSGPRVTTTRACSICCTRCTVSARRSDPS